MDKKNFAFGKMNFILLAVSMVVVIIGFLLMSGGGSNYNTYDPSIFDTRHIVIAPLVCFIGFVSMIYAIIRKPKANEEGEKAE